MVIPNVIQLKIEKKCLFGSSLVVAVEISLLSLRKTSFATLQFASGVCNCIEMVIVNFLTIAMSTSGIMLYVKHLLN